MSAAAYYLITTPSLRRIGNPGICDTYEYIDKTIVPKLMEFGRPLDINYTYSGTYADRQLTIQVLPNEVVLLMFAVYSSNLEKEYFSSRMEISLFQFAILNKDWFNSTLNQMYLHIGKMIEEYNIKKDDAGRIHG